MLTYASPFGSTRSVDRDVVSWWSSIVRTPPKLGRWTVLPLLSSWLSAWAWHMPPVWLQWMLSLRQLRPRLLRSWSRRVALVVSSALPTLGVSPLGPASVSCAGVPDREANWLMGAAPRELVDGSICDPSVVAQVLYHVGSFHSNQRWRWAMEMPDLWYAQPYGRRALHRRAVAGSRRAHVS